jgi:hypothetical protein
MRCKIGQTIASDFWTRDNAGNAYDPQHVKVSLLHSTGNEETLVYGGAAPGDIQLERLAQGHFSWRWSASRLGFWRMLEEWSDTLGAETVTAFGPNEFSIFVDPVNHTFTDVTTP